MSEFLIQENTLKNIANAIREKDGTTDDINPIDMPDKIKNISGSSGGTVEEKPFIDTSKITDFSYWFAYGARVETLDYLDTSNGIRFNNFFAGTPKTKFPNGFPFEKLNTSKGKVFRNFLNATDIDEISDYFIDTGNAYDLEGFFDGCEELTKAPLLDTAHCMFFNAFYKGCTKLSEIPQLNTSNGTLFKEMFYECHELSSIPQFDTSNGTDFSNMFYRCLSLPLIPQFDTSNGTDFSSMFRDCNKFKEIPELNTSNGTKFSNMFYGCVQLNHIPKVDMSAATGSVVTGLFYNCRQLSTIDEINFGNTEASSMTFSNMNALTNITVVGSIKVTNNYWKFNYSNTLTVESMLSILNAIEDNTGGTQYTVYFGATNLAKLTTEQKEIATNKNIKLG